MSAQHMVFIIEYFCWAVTILSLLHSPNAHDLLVTQSTWYIFRFSNTVFGNYKKGSFATIYCNNKKNHFY